MEMINSGKLPDLLVILGPTASGKTKLAVSLAERLRGEIISADSRQVYRRMNIGTGKDLSEYKSANRDIPYHLIDMLEPGEKYHVHQFRQDFQQAFETIVKKGCLPVLCGGTGLYIESVLTDRTFTAIPVNNDLRQELDFYDKDTLLKIFHSASSVYDTQADLSTRKRLIRAIEIKYWLKAHPQEKICGITGKPINFKIYGIDPPVTLRRERISKRLRQRLDEGMIEEVEGLLEEGLSPESLIYYGLEYKYITLYCTGQLEKDAMIRKLETEIHRYAKRQMTYFRHMEKLGIPIHWLDGSHDCSRMSDLILPDLKLE